jgi:signal peptidase I
LLFIAVLFLVLARFLSVWSGTPFPINLVTSDSMQPTLFEGDIVAWTPTKIEDIQVGDVIVFRSHIRWPDEKILVHRVTDIITNSRGEILLETKGDANEYPDQAGPHIPEPYIRDYALMGKVISIGQFPLKIPFVGMIGLWINQGLEAISQPATAKESLSYIGIFAPLTISAVILVILIFIIPEHAKTFKEKIKFYIFGYKPLNIKRTAVSFLVAYIVFLTVIHAFAFDSQTAAVGINAASDKEASIDFGRITTGAESTAKNLNIINPSTMPVKGVVYARGDIGEHISKEVFSLNRGEVSSAKLKAFASNITANGTYTGEVMVYSSPLWFLFSDSFIQNLLAWNPQATVYLLDLFSAIILTGFTLLILIGVTYISDNINTVSIDRSWSHYSKTIIKKKHVNKIVSLKGRVKNTFRNSMGWMLNIEYLKSEGKETFFTDYGKPIIASLVLFPLIFIIKEPILVMLLSAILGGAIAYAISCKLRKKIVLTTFIIMTAVAIYLMIQSNFIILGQHTDIMEILSFSMGAMGVYVLILSLLLLPFAAISWAIARFIRNVKEQKNPLLSLEGSCDL